MGQPAEHYLSSAVYFHDSSQQWMISKKLSLFSYIMAAIIFETLKHTWCKEVPEEMYCNITNTGSSVWHKIRKKNDRR